jgi:TRAP-type C4-dicarboxylate transport system permease large subunit
LVYWLRPSAAPARPKAQPFGRSQAQAISPSSAIELSGTELRGAPVTAMGYDLVWCGIVNLVVLETGLITPPFGIHLFVLKSLVGANVPLGVVYRGVMPFVAADFAKLALLILFPALALWLPSTMHR